MSTSPPSPPSQLAERISPRDALSVDSRRFRRQIVERCFATGEPVDRNVLTVIIAAKAARQEPLDTWSPIIIRELLWVDIVEWCLVNAVDTPGNVPEAMWAMLGSLDLTTRELGELREPLTSEAGLDANGRRRKFAKSRHPTRKRVG